MIVAAGGAFQIARIGHSGAKAVWNATSDERDEDNSGRGNSEDRDD